MKFRTTRSVDGDDGRLPDRERQRFRDAFKDFVPACYRYADNPAATWPASLRVREVEGAPGIWEMTWSLAGPDGRATFEFVQIEGSLGVQWRRTGGHSVLKEPYARVACA